MLKIRDKIEEPATGGGSSDAIDITVDDSTFQVISGTNVQAALESIDDVLDDMLPTKRSIWGTFELRTSTLVAGVTTVAAIVPFDGTIVGWTLVGNISGDAVVRVLKNDVIVSASAHPTVVASSVATSTTLTGWTTTFVAGDYYTFYLDSASDFNQLTVQLTCEETY